MATYTADLKPDTLVDREGRFYKPFQGDARSEREAAFYALLWQEGQPNETEEPGTSGRSIWGHGPMYGPCQGTSPGQRDLEGLRTLVPRFRERSVPLVNAAFTLLAHTADGLVMVESRRYLILDDVCSRYKQPCVLDAKVGLTPGFFWRAQGVCAGDDGCEETAHLRGGGSCLV
jgi:hypothetical protein